MSLVPTAFAQVAPNMTDLQNLNLGDVIYLFVALAILSAGALSIIFVFFGGFSFILSGGDEGKVKSAIHTIRYAIIGLIVSLLSLVVVPFIGSLIGFNFNFFDFATLSNRINILFDQFKANSARSSGVNPILYPNTPAPTQTYDLNPSGVQSGRVAVPINDLIR